MSYALPALIAIGQVRHRFAPSRNPVARGAAQRSSATGRIDVLREMQPESGGYLEATPLDELRGDEPGRRRTAPTALSWTPA